MKIPEFTAEASLARRRENIVEAFSLVIHVPLES